MISMSLFRPKFGQHSCDRLLELNFDHQMSENGEPTTKVGQEGVDCGGADCRSLVNVRTINLRCFFQRVSFIFH